MSYRNAVRCLLRAFAFLAFALAAQANQTYVGIFFDVGSINAGGTAALSVQLRENDGTAFTNGSITITYPAGLVNDGQYGDPLITEDCNPTESPGTVITRTAGTNQLVVTNVSLAPFRFCDIYVRITGSAFGSYTVTVPPGSFSSSTPPTTNSATTTATLAVNGPVFVTNTADSGAGSMRNAIDTVNLNCGAATGVKFNIPGPGPFVIFPGSQLPPLTCAGAFIDGYSQPGTAYNVNPVGPNNATIQIGLRGTSCGACNGLVLAAPDVSVTGLAIDSFAGDGIQSNGGSGINSITGNYIGTDAGGMAALGNLGQGINVTSGYANIGDGSPGSRNLITANQGAGILVLNGGASINGNQVGGLRDASRPFGNGNHGIYLVSANYSPDSVMGNLVIANVGAGIAVTASTFTRVVVQANESFSNQGPGLDINDDGVNPNDDISAPYDTDGVQNYPIITSVVQGGGNTTVAGYFKSLANRNATVHLYANGSPTVQPEGSQNLGSFGAPTDASGVGSFNIAVGGSWDNISAQVTLDTCNDGCIRSSEYSQSVAVSNPLVVTNTNDSGIGSLRDAINFVNANCAAQTITFNIPGAGVQTIQPVSPLPQLVCSGTTIDAYTQPGASANGLATGDNAAILVELNGALTSGNGLDIGIGAVAVRGLSITGWSGAGIFISAPAGLPGVQVTGNFIGLAADGVTTRANLQGIANGGGSTGLSIGGTGSPAERNVISGNSWGLFLAGGDGSVIQGNYIGTIRSGGAQAGNGAGIYAAGTNTVIRGNVVSGNTAGINLPGASGTQIYSNKIGVAADGTSALGNQYGVQVNTAPDTIIGAPGLGNVISANAFNGIDATASHDLRVRNNYIGTDASGTLSLGNGNDGVFVNASDITLISSNVIANNRSGVVVPNSTVQITGNSMFANVGLGINLLTDADTVVPANDPCDADGGGNGLANYPVLTNASLSGGVLTVAGTHNSTASTTFRLEFFSSPASDNPANRGGRTYLGFVSATTDGTCNATFSGTVTAAPVGDVITATSIDPSGNTSSFSNAVVVLAPAPAISSDLTSLVFAAQLTGASTQGPRITVTNSGSATMHIASIAPPAGFTFTTTCPTGGVVGLAPANTCGIDVTFNAGVSGTYAGDLVITSDASNAPAYNVPLTGVAMNAPTFSISTFTSRTPGQVSTVTVNIGDSVTNPLPYSGFSVQLDYPPGFVHDTTRPIQTSCSASVSAVGSPAVTGIAATGGSVPPGTTCGVVSSQLFAPTTPGTYTFTIPAGGFTIAAPFAYSNPSPITATVVVAAAPAPGVSLSPPSLSFAAQSVGSSSAPQVVTITNTGNAPLNIASVTATGDFTTNLSCVSPLPAGLSCTFQVTFAPTAPGARFGTVSVNSNATGSPHTMPVSGTGVALAPALSVTPSSLSFAARTVTTTSPPQTITVANTGNAALGISSIVASGDYAFVSTCPASLAPLASCTIDVTFTPLATGARNGTLTLTNNAPGSPHVVSLSGSGLSGAAPVLDVSASVMVFSAQQAGSASAPDTVTVSNAGSAPLVFVNIGITGEFSIAVPAGAGPPACPVTLAPGASCRIAVIFKPTGLNLRTGKLSIASNGGSVAIDVMGTGVIPEPPQLTAPSSLDFGSQPVGRRSAGLPLALKNVSPYVAAVTELTASGDFSVSDTCTTIAVGATCSPLLTFQPTAVGAREGLLTIRTLRDANPYAIRLTGMGTDNPEPLLEVSATQIGYGNAFVGQLISREITLRNVGQAVLQVAAVLASGDFLTTGACVGPIAPNASCTLGVIFAPSGAGGRAGQLQILSNSPDSPRFVTLSGTGCFVPSPGRARLGVPLCGP